MCEAILPQGSHLQGPQEVPAEGVEEGELSERTQRVEGAIESAYASLFGLSLGGLWIAFVSSFVWIAGAIANAVRSGGLGNLLPRLWRDNELVTAIAISFSLAIGILQLSRTYHYTHSFDRHSNDQAHFIGILTQPYRALDRMLRLSIVLLVIYSIKQGGANAFGPYKTGATIGMPDSLGHLSIFLCYLLGMFLLLFVWDLNLWLWRRGNTLDAHVAESLRRYDPSLKMKQRVAGVGFSLTTLFLLKYPASNLAILFFGMALLLFAIYWAADYRGRGLATGLVRLIKENFSWLGTIYRLFRDY